MNKVKRLRQLIKYFEKIDSLILFEYNSIWNTCHWYRMKRKAKFKKWCSRNKYEVFFVVPFTKTSLGVINSQQRQDYNKQSMKHGFKRLTHKQLIKSAYYCTT